MSAVGAGLYGMGIPKDSIVRYEIAVKTDQFLLIVHGTDVEVEKAKSTLDKTLPVSVMLHSAEVVAAA